MPIALNLSLSTVSASMHRLDVALVEACLNVFDTEEENEPRLDSHRRHTVP